MSCQEAYKIRLSECPELLRIYAGLEPLTDYEWTITDIHGVEYTDIATTTAGGNLEIDAKADYFPAGLFNRHAGSFTLQIRRNYPYLYYAGEPEVMGFCENNYDAIIMDFIKTNKDNSIVYVKCGPDGGVNSLDDLTWD